MKYRILSIVFVLILLVNGNVALAFNGETRLPMTESEVETVVTDFISQATRSVYFYEPANTEKFTLATLSDVQMDEVAARLDSVIESACKQTFFNISQAESSATQFGNPRQYIVDNLKFFEDSLAYYSHVYEMEGIVYSWFDEEFLFSNIEISGAVSTVELYHKLNYQYSDCEEPTSEIIRYQIILVNIDGEWYIAAVESDNDFYACYSDTEFNLQEALDSFDSAWNLPENILARNSTEIPVAVSNDVSTESSNNQIMQTDTDAGISIAYRNSDAANYALTYSTQSDDSKIPTYSNDKFYWNDSSCMLFASQCVWAGFGGSNTQEEIKNKQSMDDSGTNKWYSTDATATSSWTSCENFRRYVINTQAEATTEVGVHCKTLYVESDQTTMTGVVNVMVPFLKTSEVTNNYNGHYSVSGTKTTPFTASMLKGAVIHTQGSGGILGHAVVCNNATSNKRDGIYFTSYNNCRKNKKLSLSFPAGSKNFQDLYIIVPINFVNAQSESIRLYGKLENAIETGTSLDLTGFSTLNVPTLKISVFRENGSYAASTKTASNSKSVLLSYTFNSAGLWRVEVSSPGIQTFTYVVRVVDP